MWLLPMNGEAQEVLSWRQGTVKTLRILPAPKPSVAGQRDSFEHCRPLIVLADSTGPGAAFTSASFISLRSGEQVRGRKDCTDMRRKKTEARLRELAPATKGSQDAGSRNQPTLFYLLSMSVLVIKFALGFAFEIAHFLNVHF